MIITTQSWKAYIERLARINRTASAKMSAWVQKNGFEDMDAMIDYAYGLVTMYGEASGALAAEWYDAIAELSGKELPPAEVAETAPRDEVAKAMYGTRRFRNPKITSGAVERLTKRAGVDTTMKNAIRDGAEWAWVPSGDTCAFCLTLASRGWQKASASAMKGGHADHIHANCDCTYTVRHDRNTQVNGYNPDKYLKMYEDAEGSDSKDKINSLRRQLEAPKREQINARKRAAYAEREKKSNGMFRKNKNIGIYASYEELMSKKHISTVVYDMGLDPSDVKYRIEKNKDMIGSGYMGHTSDDGRIITLYPDAFVDREQLVKTIGHENIHLKQVRENGKVKTDIELYQREEEAVRSEERWWAEYVKKTGYRQQD